MENQDASNFRKLTEIEMLEVKAQLLLLEKQVDNFNLLRESLTRELVVNGVKDAEQLEEKIKKVIVQEKEDREI